MEYIEKNMDKLKELILQHDAYVIFDCPGQVELYTHHTSFRNIVDTITRSWGMQVTNWNQFQNMILVLTSVLTFILTLHLPSCV